MAPTSTPSSKQAESSTERRRPEPDGRPAGRPSGSGRRRSVLLSACLLDGVDVGAIWPISFQSRVNFVAIDSPQYCRPSPVWRRLGGRVPHPLGEGQGAALYGRLTYAVVAWLCALRCVEWAAHLEKCELVSRRFHSFQPPHSHTTLRIIVSAAPTATYEVHYSYLSISALVATADWFS